MPDQITTINQLRMKVLSGEPLSKEEARQGLELIREQRKAILDKQTKTESSRAVPLNLNDLFIPGK